MMAQYRRIKSELPKDALLLFRLGDFYELFFEDAQIGSQLLNVALTKRGQIPMCGIPFHAANGYISRILKAGRKVALCDQIEEARPGQLVKREVTQILSPGTHFDERMLTAERNNFLAAVYRSGKSFGLAAADLTTGEFITTELDNDAALLTELQRLKPTEIVHPAEDAYVREIISGAPSRQPGGSSDAKTSPNPSGAYGWILNAHEDWVFAPETAVYAVKDHFKVASLDGFGLKDRTAAIGAAGGILNYITQHLRRNAANLTRISFYQQSAHLILDHTTLRHLEILEPLRHDAPSSACLCGAMQKTVTPMGGRRLRAWLSQPLASVEAIRKRQAAVAAFLNQTGTLDTFRAKLTEVRDIERTLGRLSSGSGNARDLQSLRVALERLPEIKRTLNSIVENEDTADRLQELPRFDDDSRTPNDSVTGSKTVLAQLIDELSEMPELVDLISRAIVDEPPLATKEGGMIRDGFDANLDEIRKGAADGKIWIAKLQQDEITRTGIQSLKIRFNSVFGYYIEITKTHLDKVPQHYIRKQTVANGERFITPELKEVEGKVLGAEERSTKLEYELFQRVREEVLGRMPSIQQTGAALAQLDVLACFAGLARLHNYCRPDVRDENVLTIRDGRHPVLEQALVEERFVPNDAAVAGILSSQGNGDNHALSPAGGANGEEAVALPQIMLITGPNMAGKSTYIRQVALIALLAHTGSFVPAREARIDRLDRIFTRIGASDDLSRGQSTFMVEMCETANILNHATPRSLVILDEIGRGTSTFDGLSLAWSIVEYLHNQIGAKTLFATHYHELTELAARLFRLRNFNVAVREWHDQIVFLRKIIEGGTDKSYGIQVARLAGVPKPILDRAKEILRNLEESELTPEGNVRQPSRRQQDREKLKQLAPAPQMDLFR
jgi:DNA mismatch repair protein MutS